MTAFEKVIQLISEGNPLVLEQLEEVLEVKCPQHFGITIGFEAHKCDAECEECWGKEVEE